MKACLNDLCTKPESPAGKPSSRETYVIPQNTLGVSSLRTSFEDRLRAAGKSVPALAEPTSQEGMFARVEKFLQDIRSAESGPAVPLCDCESAAEEDEGL